MPYLCELNGHDINSMVITIYSADIKQIKVCTQLSVKCKQTTKFTQTWNFHLSDIFF